MRIAILILGVLLAQIGVAQELKLAFPTDSLRLGKIMAYEDNYSGSVEVIIDTIDVFATVIDWEAQTVHQTFLKEVRIGHMEMQQVFCPENGEFGLVYRQCWQEVPVWTDRDYYEVRICQKMEGLGTNYLKVFKDAECWIPVHGQVTNVIYKPENNDK